MINASLLKIGKHIKKLVYYISSALLELKVCYFMFEEIAFISWMIVKNLIVLSSPFDFSQHKLAYIGYSLQTWLFQPISEMGDHIRGVRYP